MVNIPAKIKISNYSTPIKKTGQYGEFYTLFVKHEGVDKVWFVSDKAWEKISMDISAMRGEATILISQVPGQKYTEMKVVKALDNPQPTQPKEFKGESEDDKWSRITLRKVRHGVAIAFIERAEPLTAETKEAINEWTAFIINGE